MRLECLIDMSTDIRIGISGWRYKPWRGVFFPADLPQRAELEFASRVFTSIEINGSFYSLQRPECYATWYAQTPPNFVFAVKGGRYITHMRKLKDVRVPLANFFASGPFNLREKLGPILWQLPPMLSFNKERIASFLELLPRDTQQALSLARARDARLKGRARLAIDANRPLRHAMEVRHETYRNPEFIELLREHNVALVVADTAKRWPYLEDVTADFMYLRLHGEKTLYTSGYPDKSLDRWAERIRTWSAGREPADARHVSQIQTSGAAARDIYCYFDNTDAKLRAPFDAQKLMEKLNVGTGARVRRQRPKAAATESKMTAG